MTITKFGFGTLYSEFFGKTIYMLVGVGFSALLG